MKNLTYEECCSSIAVKYKLGNNLVTGHSAKYWKEAAELYKNQDCDLCKAMNHIKTLREADWNWLSNKNDSEEEKDYSSLGLEFSRKKLIEVLEQIESFEIEYEGKIKYLNI